ncbi:carboxylesterase family protein [Fusarium oxysporum f. sp. phaseoli]
MATVMGHQPQVHRATNEALASPGPEASQDVNFIEPNSDTRPSSIPSPSPSSRGILQELSADQVHNKSLAWNSSRRENNQNQQLYLKTSPIKLPTKTNPSRGPRRSLIDSDSFELLDAVPEESIESSDSDTAPSGPSALTSHKLRSPGTTVNSHPLLDAEPQIGHNLESHLAATPLIAAEYLALGFDPSQVKMALPPPPAYELHQNVPLKIPEVIETVEPVSPSLTLISERGSSYAGSSRTGSFSVPRIEDSFEELDKLEDELEAIKAFTQPQRIPVPENTAPSNKHLEPPSTGKKPTVSKRASVIGMSSTVRIKQTERPQLPLRRSTSLVFRDKKQGDSDNMPNLKPQTARGKLTNSQSAPLKAPVKSTKPPTVPHFELPGEAVSRRLKEQREARRAQQAEAQKAYAPPPRPKSSKPLTKPNFELPGEAISRRKREEREARLKAQEEEEQKKREFKARPVRHSLMPGSIPRETITSLARQGKLPQDEATKTSTSTKVKRMSMQGPRPPTMSEAPVTQSRGRLSTATSREDLSRATSTSTGSGGGKRTTLTAEEAYQLRLRGKEIFQRDNTSFTRDRERERREREEATRLAREQAAERSRIASREWAEKKRRKELAMLESLKGH